MEDKEKCPVKEGQDREGQDQSELSEELLLQEDGPFKEFSRNTRGRAMLGVRHRRQAHADLMRRKYAREGGAPHRPPARGTTSHDFLKNLDINATYLSREEVRELMDRIHRRANPDAPCHPGDFPGDTALLASRKALMVNLYVEYGGNWLKVLEDERSCSKATLSRWWRDDRFRILCEACDPFIALQAEATVVDIMQNAEKPSDRLNAATRFLEAKKGEIWDRGIRRQVVANKGSLTNTLFAKAVNQEDFWKALANDPFAMQAIQHNLPDVDANKLLEEKNSIELIPEEAHKGGSEEISNVESDESASSGHIDAGDEFGSFREYQERAQSGGAGGAPRGGVKGAKSGSDPE